MIAQINCDILPPINFKSRHFEKLDLYHLPAHCVSVRLAMNDQTRNVIDRELYRENSRLQQPNPYSQNSQWNNGDNAYYKKPSSNPEFPNTNK